MAHLENSIPMMLSTPDNPYNPFDQFDDWYEFDERHGYYTSGYVARIAFTGRMLSDDENEVAINDAVRRIYQANPKGMYVIYYGDGRIEQPTDLDISEWPIKPFNYTEEIKE